MNNSKSGFTPILFVIMIAIITGIIFANNVISGREKRINEKALAREKRINEKALTDKKGRYLTIINDTEQVINDVRVTLKSGTEIESLGKKNPEERSFSFKIPIAYNEYDVFIVSLTDVFGLKYEKEVRGVSKAGRTDVVLTEDDYVKRRGDLKRRIDKFFNSLFKRKK